MFYFVIYASQLIRKLKNMNISVSHAQFVNNEKYRQKILQQAREINDKECHYLAALIEQENIDKETI